VHVATTILFSVEVMSCKISDRCWCSELASSPILFYSELSSGSNISRFHKNWEAVEQYVSLILGTKGEENGQGGGTNGQRRRANLPAREGNGQTCNSCYSLLRFGGIIDVRYILSYSVFDKVWMFSTSTDGIKHIYININGGGSAGKQSKGRVLPLVWRGKKVV